MKDKKEKPEGYVLGRPTKYRKEYCEQLVEWMREGKSFWTFASTIPCSIDTICEWTHQHEEFSEAKKVGKSLEQAWWDNLHRRCAATGEGNMTAIVWAQKNKFPKYYKERVAKGAIQHNINQQLSATCDFKSIVANMPPEQMMQLISAVEQRTIELEKSKDD